MAGTVNKVIIIGHLGGDPEIKAMTNGNKVATLSVATSETWRDKTTGERKEKTEWHRCSIFNDGLVKLAEQYLKKGAKVYLEGSLQTRKWVDQAGHDRYTTEIVLGAFNSSMQMLDRLPGGRPPSPESEADYGRPASPAGASSRRDDMNDDIPF